MLSETDGDGNVTAYAYEPDGDLLSETRYAVKGDETSAHTTSYTRYPDGSIHTRTDPNGKVTTFIPDPEGSQEGVAADSKGNIYGSLTSGMALKKYNLASVAPADK